MYEEHCSEWKEGNHYLSYSLIPYLLEVKEKWRKEKKREENEKRKERKKKREKKKRVCLFLNFC